jgi:hypothetical protein
MDVAIPSAYRLLSASDHPQEIHGPDDGDPLVLPQCEKVPVAGDDHVGAAEHRAGDDLVIIGITGDGFWNEARAHDVGLAHGRSQHPLELTLLPAELPPKLLGEFGDDGR